MDLLLSFKSKILICTPEKLSYIIHHQIDFLDEIGLYIFDEGHMFDDGSRGAIYELLISEIRDHISRKEQIILLSAVLSNAEQIQKWLLGEAGVLASDPKIKATPKTIGFTSQTKDIHYYSDDSTQEDFYVPRSIEVVALQKRPKERKQRYFPELSDTKDIAIYYANKLCKNGGVAIFANRTSTVKTVINRIIELDERGYDLTVIKENSDAEEMNRLAKLMSDYYGAQYPYTRACHLGIVPHYSDLPNGLRLAVEHAFRGRLLHFVVCTSTLAQGVNIPIKYLIITAKVSTLDYARVKKYAKTMIGIDLSLQIEKWITENRFTQQNYSNEQILDMLMSFFLETHTLKKGTEFFTDICKMWLDGCPFIEMSERTSLPIAAIEDICSKSVSYELSFFVGNIIDVIEISDEDIVNPLPSLLLLQRKIKYGVKTETAVSVCEKIFNDRFLANRLAEEMGHDTITTNKIVGVVKSHKEEIFEILSAYPTYFSERIEWMCKD